MQEIIGDILNPDKDVDAIVIPTNLSIRKNGYAVMGSGLAKEADKKWKLAERLGNYIRRSPYCSFYGKIDDSFNIVFFPTKNNWRNKSDISLIRKSAEKLVSFANSWRWQVIWLPKVGCGLGKLDWQTQVKPVLEKILDDRFYIVSKRKEEK